MAPITEKTKVGTTMRIAIGLCITLFTAGVMGERWKQSITDDARNNRDIIMAHIDSLSRFNIHQIDVNNNQANFNSEVVDFRRRVEFKLGWR